METYLGYNAKRWHNLYRSAAEVSDSRARKIRELEARVARQRRTIESLMEEKQQTAVEAQEQAVDAPVEINGPSTLEQRVIKLESRAVQDNILAGKVDGAINAILDRLNALEEQSAPVEIKDSYLSSEIKDLINIGYYRNNE